MLMQAPGDNCHAGNRLYQMAHVIPCRSNA
jgi:hypothetical protein